MARVGRVGHAGVLCGSAQSLQSLLFQIAFHRRFPQRLLAVHTVNAVATGHFECQKLTPSPAAVKASKWLREWLMA